VISLVTGLGSSGVEADDDFILATGLAPLLAAPVVSVVAVLSVEAFLELICLDSCCAHTVRLIITIIAAKIFFIIILSIKIQLP
jgi:hypothetical protein